MLRKASTVCLFCSGSAMRSLLCAPHSAVSMMPPSEAKCELPRTPSLGEVRRILLPRTPVNKPPGDAPDTSGWHHGCCCPAGKTWVGKKENFYDVGKAEHGTGPPFHGGKNQRGLGHSGRD